MNNALIISGKLVQDHEFIYPYYRLLEENFNVDVCLLGGKPVEGILGTLIPPNKDQPIIDVKDINTEKYALLIIPGGAKAMEYLRQEGLILKKIKEFNDKDIIIHPMKDKSLQGFDIELPGDISSASYLIAAAVILHDSRLVINDLLLNP